jgi:hypothetical protein
LTRLISRTLSYTLVTGMLVGVHAGVVTLATRVLPVSSAVGVAASTLAVAALFSPVRRRVQHPVERPFSRGPVRRRDDRGGIRGAAEEHRGPGPGLDDLAGVVGATLEPAHVPVRISQRG